MFTGYQVEEQLKCLPPNKYDSYLKGKERPPGFGDRHNWHKRSIFWELSYWKSLLIRHALDVMHVKKNLFDNLFFMLIDTRDKKNKDDLKGRKNIEKFCNRPELELIVRGDKVLKLKVTYTLSKVELRGQCKWLKKLKFPNGYVSNIVNCVNNQLIVQLLLD